MGSDKDKFNFEKLFLFEFLIDHLVIYNSKLNLEHDVLNLLGPVIVNFRILNYPPLLITEQDFTPSTKPLMEEKKIFLKSGRSCMFSLNSQQAKKFNRADYDLNLSVFREILNEKKQNEGEKTDEYFVGSCKIQLNDMFKELFDEKLTSDNTKNMTRTKALAEKLKNCSGDDVGRIVCLIRISCFGHMVVTGFQLTDEEKRKFEGKYKSFRQPKDIRKSDDTGKPDKRRSVEEAKKGKLDTCCRTSPRKSTEPPAEPKKPSAVPKKRSTNTCPFGFPKQQQQQQQQPVCQPKPASCPCANQGTSTACQSSRQQSRGSCMGSGMAPKPFVQGPCPCQNQFRPPCPNQFPYPYPVNTGGSFQPQHGNIANDMNIDPGAVGLRGNQLVFKMPDKNSVTEPVEGKFSSAVYYKMDGEKEEGARNVIQILPQNPATKPDKTITSDKQDVLVLKLGKKRIAAGKKPKLELELRTPKMKDEKPETETQCTQYLEADIPKPAKGKPGSAKSKGGKKKK